MGSALVSLAHAVAPGRTVVCQGNGVIRLVRGCHGRRLLPHHMSLRPQGAIRLNDEERRRAECSPALFQ